MEKLPSEIQWHIIKFTRHPVAEVFIEASADITYLDDSYYCMHGLSFAFNWFHEKLYEQHEAIRERNLPKEVELQLLRGIKRNWDLYTKGHDINL